MLLFDKLWRNWFFKGQKIYSNIHLFKIPYIYISNVEQLDLIQYEEGVGSYCVHPEQEVICTPTVKNISDIKIGDKVLTHKGRFMPVTKVYKREYEGQLVSVRTRKFSMDFKVTPEHPIYTAKKTNLGKYEFSWKKAEDMSEKDSVVYPIVNDVADNCYKDKYHCVHCGSENLGSAGLSPNGKSRIMCKDCKRRFITKYFNVNEYENYFDEDVCYLYGLFMADGHANVNGGKVRFAVEKKLVDKVTKKIINVFSIEPKIYEMENYYEIAINSTKLARIFNKLGKMDKKSPPKDILNLPVKYKNAFLDGYLDGDGYFDKKANRWSFSTVSPTLMTFLNQIILNSGKIPIVVKMPPQKRGKGKRDFYSCIITNKSLAGEIYDDGNGQKNLILPIKRLIKEKYSGKVYNLKVKEDNSYTFMNGAVHNCGLDELWLVADSRMSKSVRNRFVSNILGKSRKRGLTYVSTAQVADSLESRIRKVLDFTFYPMLSRDENICKLLVFRGGYVKNSNYMKTLYYKTPLIKSLYDTREELQMMDNFEGVDNEKEEVKLPKWCFQENFNSKHGYMCECDECGTKFFDTFEEADAHANAFYKKHLATIKKMI